MSFAGTCALTPWRRRGKVSLIASHSWTICKCRKVHPILKSTPYFCCLPTGCNLKSENKSKQRKSARAIHIHHMNKFYWTIFSAVCCVVYGETLDKTRSLQIQQSPFLWHGLRVQCFTEVALDTLITRVHLFCRRRAGLSITARQTDGRHALLVVACKGNVSVFHSQVQQESRWFGLCTCASRFSCTGTVAHQSKVMHTCTHACIRGQPLSFI